MTTPNIEVIDMMRTYSMKPTSLASWSRLTDVTRNVTEIDLPIGVHMIEAVWRGRAGIRFTLPETGTSETISASTDDNEQKILFTVVCSSPNSKLVPSIQTGGVDADMQKALGVRVILGLPNMEIG